jgi:caffeoyl-CoA O-methyltransferase
VVELMADASSRSGHRYATPEILSWLDAVHASHDEGLAQAFAAPDFHGMPPIQLGISESKLLTLLLRMIQAKKVVELGTLAGYSAIRIAQGLSLDGHLWTVELDPKHAEVAAANARAAGESGRITILQGPALMMLAQLEQHAPFDAIFLDADKGNYDAYGRWAAKVLRPGGLLIGDNAYLFGQLMNDTNEARAMRRFHEESKDHFDTACVPTPDGLLLGIKR